MGKAKDMAREHGFAQTLFGRRRFLPEINSRDPRLRAQAERMAINMPVQGTCADIIKMAMVELARQKILSKECRLLLQIHDELLFEVKSGKIKTVAPKIKGIMEGVVNLEAPLRAGIKIGNHWGEV